MVDAHTASRSVIATRLALGFAILLAAPKVAHADCNGLMQAVVTFSIELSERRILISAYEAAITEATERLQTASESDRARLQTQLVNEELNLDRALREHREIVGQIEARGPHLKRECRSG